MEDNALSALLARTRHSRGALLATRVLPASFLLGQDRSVVRLVRTVQWASSLLLLLQCAPTVLRAAMRGYQEVWSARNVHQTLPLQVLVLPRQPVNVTQDSVDQMAALAQRALLGLTKLQ